ncbi:MAG: TetR/AcrR family transcriptional regulator [Eubacterium sp.]|jgi:AcrR family transcriptional regulator|nr:TetR/AcrR family transcriptional regulator [Eubacterium sp.]MCH4046643.1 TetR/AcrR family transcriptional regulator [Eubacterium sp.]MCH4079739.1 TetR/AcrR family transcriptional regulator [Eubacterium sp.]MCH4110299.1 TetR/AcrR family transcriptional regulator [Eubacterium sp.]MCI1307088.1 TetR/AcrR family transcriptional regulator [Eubacterium sp.]
MGRKKRTTKQKIVDAAWKLFYTKGYDETTIEDIIKESKTSKGSFYHYFKGKDALLSTLSDLFDQKYLELAEEEDPDMSASDKLLHLNDELFHMIEENVDIHLLAYMYATQLTTDGERHLLNNNRFYFQYITSIIKDGLDSGEFYQGFTLNQLVKIYAMFERSMLYDWALCKGAYSLTTISTYLLKSILDRFRNGFDGAELDDKVKQTFIDAYMSS